MRKGGKPARLKLFAQLEAELRRNVIGKQGVILCPLCLGEFGLDAAESGVLTEEHVIPESTGNREVTLSCKKCNSTLGHEIDEQIDRKVRLDRGFKGNARMKGRLKWAEGGAPVDFEYPVTGGIHIHVKPTTQKMAESLMERAHQHNSGERPLHIRLMTGLRREDFLAAVAKAAYLGLFVDRGYSYILLPSLEQIRKAIAKYGVDRARLSDIIVPCEISGFSELPGAPDRLTFETHSLNGVPVCLSLINLRNSSGAAWVVLPPGVSPNTGSWDGLARAAEKLRGKDNVEVSIKPGGEVVVRGL
jgi:hypothetical protein